MYFLNIKLGEHENKFDIFVVNKKFFKANRNLIGVCSIKNGGKNMSFTCSSWQSQNRMEIKPCSSKSKSTLKRLRFTN